MMTIHVMCLTADGGLPIFTRKKGICENLPFSTVASLNGVHMFFKSMGMRMQATETDDWTLIWKDYEEVITLMLCGQHMSEIKLQQISDLVFYAMKLFISSDDLKNCSKNVDRLKRESKQYMPIVDRILESLQSDLLGYNECILASENTHLLAKLNEFSTLCDSLFCCIVINQKIAVGTEGWWDLDLIDRKLLITMLNSSDRSQTDIPVYLPKKSSNVAYRFVSVAIAGCGILCTICGADPSYQEINNIAQNVFKNEIELINHVERGISRNLPEEVELNEYILKTVLLNKTTKKYVFSRNLQHSSAEKCSVGQNHFDIIRTYVDEVLKLMEEEFDVGEEAGAVKLGSQHWCSDYHKCYSHVDDESGNIFVVLFTASVPTFAMRLIVQKTFDVLMQEKNTCW